MRYSDKRALLFSPRCEDFYLHLGPVDLFDHILSLTTLYGEPSNIAQGSHLQNMGFITRFKAERAVPRLTTTRTPGFNLYSFPTMRRLTTLTGSTSLIGPGTPLLTLWVPGNWWADGHEIIWRFYFTWVDGGVPPPPGLIFTESCLPNQGGFAFAFPTPAPPAAVNTVQCCISRRMIRQNTQILFYDDDFPGPQFGISGVVQGIPGIIIAPPIGGWDFSQELQFIWSITNAGPPWAVTITVNNAIALIAPPLTLRS
jgi:hypothetical protein